ncbi:MBL fold metallo-hydrolase [Virgibacillus halophilus]|uniref:MBL fold metallo-hydrolase n=1 Tax=Tigheibacillus halophilus TaxID=361280 RepID=UPI00363D742D
MNINITTFQLGPIGTNCYLLEIDAAVLIVDPGGDAEVLTNYIATHQLTPVAIVLTHAHFDHIGAVEQLQHTYDLNVYLHEAEHSWLTDPHKNGSSGMLHHEVTVQVSPLSLGEGQVSIGDFSFHVLHTPGHSPGSISLVFNDFVLDGDTLFHQGIGRTDLFGGDMTVLKKTICGKLCALPDHYAVYPGHGSSTFIGTEKSNNPFFKAKNCDD